MKTDFTNYEEAFKPACPGDATCTSDGVHVTGCTKLKADLTRFKESRDRFYSTVKGS